MADKCRKCLNVIANDSEYCWYCDEPMCYDCWEEYGHCGHPIAYMQEDYANSNRKDRVLMKIITEDDFNLVNEKS